MGRACEIWLRNHSRLFCWWNVPDISVIGTSRGNQMLVVALIARA